MMKLNRHNLTKYFLLPFLLVLMVSCEKEANISIKNVDDKIVVVSTFTPNEPFSLKLSKSTSLFSDSSPQALEDAIIQICKGENCVLLGRQTNIIGGNDGNGIRFATGSFRAQTDTPFTLKVKVNGLADVNAEASIPEAVQMTHVAVGASTQLPSDQSANNSEIEYETKISLSFDDPVGEDNYYQVNFSQVVEVSDGNLVLKSDTIPNVDFSSFDSDIVNLRNITDGGVLINGKDFDGLKKDLLFQPTFKFDSNNEDPVSIIVELRTVSKAYFDYYSSVYRQVNQGSDPFIQPVQIVSNIENGLGVFAGYSKDEVIRDLEF